MISARRRSCSRWSTRNFVNSRKHGWPKYPWNRRCSRPPWSTKPTSDFSELTTRVGTAGGHFFGAAAQAIRRILVDRARRHASLKRGGDRQRVSMSDVQPPQQESPHEILALNDALEELEQADTRKAQVVLLRHQIRHRIHAEDEAIPRLVPAVQVARLGEVRVAAEQNTPKTRLLAQTPRTVQVVGRSFVRRAIARSVHVEQGLGGVGQGHQQRVLAPLASV